MIIPCNVQGFKKAQIGDCCVFRTYRELNTGRGHAVNYGLLIKTLSTTHTTTRSPYGFEIVYVPKVVSGRYSGKTKFDPATIEKMKKILNRG